MKQFLQKKGTEQLDLKPQKGMPEAALSVHVCNPKYRSQGRPPKRRKSIAGKRTNYLMIYRVSIKSFPDYKHLLQENYIEYKYIFLPLLKLVSKILCHMFIVLKKKSLYST
jgi:hypothetical protein